MTVRERRVKIMKKCENNEEKKKMVKERVTVKE